jgi:YggT family protein
MGWLFLSYLLRLLEWLIIIRALLSWFVSPHSRHPLVVLLQRITDPILRPISQVVPVAGGFDISPLIAILLLELLQRVIGSMMFMY